MTQSTQLTPVEREVQRMMMREHKLRKCWRCQGRYDLSDGGFICQRGEDAKQQMSSQKDCRKFLLDEDPDKWIGE